MELIVFALMHGTVFGVLIFLLASGLTLTFSLMGVLNFAHASFYMLGAHISFSITYWFTSHKVEVFGTPIAGFWFGLVFGPIIVGILGALLQRYVLNYARRNGHIPEMIFTFSLSLLITHMVVFIWRGSRKPHIYTPESLKGIAFEFYNTSFPVYSVFMLAVSITIFIILLTILTKTRLGLIVRASLTHPHVVANLGHNLPRIYMLVFGTGCMLAGVAGAIAGPALSISPTMALELGNIVFVVIVFGGLGSLSGAFVASIIMGIIQTYAAVSSGSLVDVAAKYGWNIESSHPYYDILSLTLPQISTTLPFVLMVLILILRPQGLMGNRD